jgi:hypothetical protein
VDDLGSTVHAFGDDGRVERLPVEQNSFEQYRRLLTDQIT